MKIHYKYLQIVLLVLSTMLGIQPLAKAAAISFPSLSQDSFDKAIREFTANSYLHSVTPASSMGSIFGFEVGLIAGITKTPEIDALVQANSGTSVSMLPHAGLLGALTIPFGITAEVVLVPKTDMGDLKYQQFAGALKWTATDSVLSMLPLNLAVRGFLSQTQLSYTQTISSVDSTVTIDDQVMGLQLLASPKLIPIIEPYIGVGMLSGKGKMDVSGTSTLFNFTTAQSAESSPSSSQLFMGIEARLLLLTFGVEYSRAFETDSYTGKFSLKF